MVKLNLITLSGNLTKDAELKVSQNGNKFLVGSIAYNFDKLENGQWVSESTTFLNFVCYGKTAETQAQRAKKGVGALLVGKLKQEYYTDQYGNQKSMFRIIASELKLDKPAQDQQQAPETQKVDMTPPPPNTNEFGSTFGSAIPTVDFSDDEIPF